MLLPFTRSVENDTKYRSAKSGTRLLAQPSPGLTALVLSGKEEGVLPVRLLCAP